uniref:Heat shock protein, alpha-crystallin-related, b11 n=1 Tax=Mastacembelus armatus TaxID=205130 RepID=A0A7N8WVQ0_9TELE
MLPKHIRSVLISHVYLLSPRKTNTFWMSTGMFPQEFIIRFAEPTSVFAVTVDSYNVKHLKIEKNATQNVSQFEFVAEKGKGGICLHICFKCQRAGINKFGCVAEFENTEGHLQSNAISLNGGSVTHLRFIITAGYDHFVSVHRVSIQN